MIRYTLKCDNDHRFDSWFSSAEDFDRLKAAGHVSCPECGDSAVEKSLMAREYGIISLKRFDRNYFRKYGKNELRIMRNELFAFHGYDFNSNRIFIPFPSHNLQRDL